MSTVQRSVSCASGLYVNGAWREPDAADRPTVHDPASGAEVGRAVAASRADVRRAIESAQRAFPAWAARSPDERAAPLRRACELVVERADELARALTLEGGKPVAVKFD